MTLSVWGCDTYIWMDQLGGCLLLCEHYVVCVRW